MHGNIGFPYFDPPLQPADWTMEASKMVASLQNLCGQVASKDGAVVTPDIVFWAFEQLLLVRDRGGVGIVVPGGASVNTAYRKGD